LQLLRVTPGDWVHGIVYRVDVATKRLVVEEDQRARLGLQ
jgi:hypothetical protein